MDIYHEIRFWNLVSIGSEDECWMWKGAIDADGYGFFRHEHRNLKSHRVAFKIHHKQDPQSGLVCHSCDVPGCCNPKHLFLGTPSQNMQDMASKGRFPNRKGSMHPLSVMTEQAVVEIRRKSACGESTKALAAEYKTCKSNIWLIVSGKSWKHV